MLAARGLVRVLNDINNGDTAKAASISALESMLPPKGDVAGKAFEISRLTALQVGVFEKLVAIGCGEEPQREHRAKSTHWFNAVSAAALLDRFFARAASPGEDHKYVTPKALIATESNPVPIALTAREQVELRSHIDALLSPLRVVDLYREVLANAFAPSQWVSPPPVVEENALEPAFAASRGNVVSIRPEAPSAFAGAEFASGLGAGPSHPALFDASDPSGRRSGKP
jgi:hypothetical protein